MLPVLSAQEEVLMKIQSFKKSLIVLGFISGSVFANAAPSESSFFANNSVQRLHPEAYVLQPETEAFVRSLHSETIDIRNDLVKAIQAVPELYRAVKNWEMLSFDEQVPYLKQIFSIEVKLMKITPPELVIDAKEIPGRAAYFDFNPEEPGPGRVILNPEVLKKMDKYAALALLIHETRHSAQFQMAFNGDKPASTSAQAYHAAFLAQKTEIRSFCDFLTLANEFEAFQFGNYVLGSLTDWNIHSPDMGTFASQYTSDGKLKLDLVRLLDNGEPKSLIEKFNEAEVEQCKLLGFCQR